MRIHRFLMIATVSALVAACNPASEPTPAPAAAPAPAKSDIARLDPGLDTIFLAGAKVEKVASGFKFLEGPLWRSAAGGSLWFSDLVGNILYEWTPDGKTREVLNPGGYDGKDAPAGGYIGPNGMVV